MSKIKSQIKDKNQITKVSTVSEIGKLIFGNYLLFDHCYLIL